MVLDTSATTKLTMAQEGDAEISTSFSKLNVNAMEFVPSFAATATASNSTTAAAAGATTTITNSHQEEEQQQQQEINNEIQQQADAAAPPPPQPTQPPLSLPLDKFEDLATPNNGKLCE